MKAKIRLFSLLLALLVLAGNVFAGPELISAKELKGKMKDKNVIIVSTRAFSDYQQVHLPGAVNVWHIDLYTDPTANGYIKSPEELAKIFGSKGISETKTIVLYDAGSGKNSGRLYWILKYLGAKDVRILDGQMKAWRAQRGAVTKAPAKVEAVTFTPSVQKAIFVSTAQVSAAKGKSGTVIVDVRSAEEFNGTDETDIRKGHIPGAVNLEFKNVLTDAATFKSPEELKKIFTAQGITADKEIILYCRTSVRAGIVYFALTDILGYKNVKVYDKAFIGWQSASANQVVK